MKTAAKLRLAAIKKKEKSGKKDKRASNDDIETAASEDYSIVPKEQRPQHRLGSIPFFGEKVDTIEWAREEIRVCTELLEKGRAIIESDGKGVRKDNRVSEETEEDFEDPDANKTNDKDARKSYPPMNSAFVTFNRQIAAHLAMQVLAHHEPYRMSMWFFAVCFFTFSTLGSTGSKYVEVSPEDVIWANLGLNPYEQKVCSIFRSSEILS